MVDKIESEIVPMIDCPAEDCDVSLPEDDLTAQTQHMGRYHPDIIEARLAESRKLDGWEQD